MAKLKLEQVRLDGGTQMRVGPRNEEALAEYADAIENGVELPPVTVFFDGWDYWLADGFHRHTVYKNLGNKYIEAEVKEGSKRDAILYAVGANANHGLRRTNADKRRAVETLLKDEQWTTWSDREIARRCGVHHELVGRIRPELSGGFRQIARTVSRGGTTYTQNTANIGARAQELEPDECPQRESRTDEAPETDPIPPLAQQVDDDPGPELEADDAQGLQPSALVPSKPPFRIETPPGWTDPTKPSPLEANIDALGKALDKLLDFHKQDGHALLRHRKTQIAGVTRLAQLAYDMLGEWLGEETPAEREAAAEREARTITVEAMN